MKKEHVKYYLENGDEVTSITTALSIINKPALVSWANKMGMQGVSSKEAAGVRASVGTLAHALCRAWVARGHGIQWTQAAADIICAEEFNGEGLPSEMIDQALAAFTGFKKWVTSPGNKEPVVDMCEAPMVSEVYRYGGTPDLVFKENGGYSLYELKTSPTIYKEYIYQIAAQRQLIKEVHHINIDKVGIVLLPIKEDTEPTEVSLPAEHLDKGFTAFLLALDLYNTDKMFSKACKTTSLLPKKRKEDSNDN